MNGIVSVEPRRSDWTAQQILAWMDSFRALVLDAQPPDINGRAVYDRVRDADPMRRIPLGHGSDGSAGRP